MRKFLSRDRLTAIVLIAISAGYALMTFQLGDNSNAKDPGAKLFPLIACAGLALCGLVILLQNREDDKPYFTKQGWLDVGLMTAMMAAYVFLLKHLGFLIDSVLLLFGMTSLIARGKDVPLWKRLLFSVLLPVIIYAIFVKLLNTRLPRGILYF